MNKENTQSEEQQFEKMNHNKRMSFICQRLAQRQINKEARNKVLAMVRKWINIYKQTF